MSRWMDSLRAIFARREREGMSNITSTIDAASIDSGWMQLLWPSLETNQEYCEGDLDVIRRRARAMYYNSPIMRGAVKNMVNFTGVLTPQPRSGDEEWNKDAAAAFLARTKNPKLFDLSGRLNLRQWQRWAEKWAIIDGDVGLCPTYAADGGAAFGCYKAPQIRGGRGNKGVEVDAHNRAMSYTVTDEHGRTATVPAYLMLLYSHEPDACETRGISEMVAAIRHCKDIRDFVGYTKKGVELAAQFGLVETMDLNDKKPGIGGIMAPGGNTRRNAAPADEPGLPRVLAGTTVTITPLRPGRELKPIADNRPSQEVQKFLEHLVKQVAWAEGLDPEMLFYTPTMGSAAARLNMEKLKRWCRARWDDREYILNRIWTHVISCEIQCKRLRPCAASDWRNVVWVPEPDMTIDLGRVAKAKQDLIRVGLADADNFTLATEGLTYKALLERRAANIAYAHQVADANGISFEELVTDTALGHLHGAPAPQWPGDDDPEETGADEGPQQTDDNDN